MCFQPPKLELFERANVTKSHVVQDQVMPSYSIMNLSISGAVLVWREGQYLRKKGAISNLCGLVWTGTGPHKITFKLKRIYKW